MNHQLTNRLAQAIVFHLEEHPSPKMKGFYQCVTRNYFDAQWKEIVYNTSTLVIMYIIPLIFIIVCYTAILRNIAKTTGDVVSTEKSISPTENESTNHKSNKRASVAIEETTAAKLHTFNPNDSSTSQSYIGDRRCKLIDRFNCCRDKLTRGQTNLNKKQFNDVTREPAQPSESINQFASGEFFFPRNSSWSLVLCQFCPDLFI